MPVPAKKAASKKMAPGRAVFEFSPGSRLPKKSAQKIGERLLALAGSIEKVTPDMAVQDAMNPRSPLHRYIFDVDDAAAAYEYRLDKARNILRSLVTYYVDNQGVKIRARAWHAVRDESAHIVYRPSTFVWKDVDASQQVIDRAKAELESWVSRYEEYKMLSKAVKAAKLAILVLK